MSVKSIDFHKVSKKNNPFPSIGELSDYLAQNENNDCVVRAVKHAFDVTYAEAHYFCENKLMRKRGEGAYTDIYLPGVKQAFGKKVKVMGKKNDWGRVMLLRPIKRHRTNRIDRIPFKVKEFIKAHPKGSYILTVRRHAFALVDGFVFGNWDDSRRENREVISAYRIG